MGESFTIQISSSLVKKLLDAGEKVKKKTRKPKPKVPEEPQISPHQKQLSDDPSPTRWPVQMPFYLPPPKAASPEIDGIHSVLEESEKAVGRLKKQEENMLQEVTQRVKDLHDMEFKLPNHKPVPCVEEKDACLKCYKEHVKDPLKCAQMVKDFADCARSVRRQVSTDEPVVA